jgi:hypothetical protein
MPEHRGVGYAIRWKEGWEWEVFATLRDATGIVRGLTTWDY